MGRRRRTKVQVRPKPKIPNIFDCPVCSKKTISVTFDKEQNTFDINCSNCGKKYHYTNPTHFPIKFMCPNCNEKSVSVEFIDATNSIRITCSSCSKSAFYSAKEWEQDPDNYSIIRFTPGGAKLGCPECTFRTITIKVKLRKDFAVVQCGACGLKDIFPVTSLDEKVDVYGKFIDTVRANMKVLERMKPEELQQMREKAKRFEEVAAPVKKLEPAKPSFMEKEELFEEEEEEAEAEETSKEAEPEAEEEGAEEEEEEEDFKL
jgi:transcription elongation factor Elf1